MAKIFIGPKLRQLRKSAGQTQSYLANELKVKILDQTDFEKISKLR